MARSQPRRIAGRKTSGICCSCRASAPARFGPWPSEDAAVSFIQRRIAKGTVVHADESPAWNPLHAKFSMKRINHEDGYSIEGACTNGAESYFCRLRRGELGHHHHIAGPYLARYAQEAAWREDDRRL